MDKISSQRSQSFYKFYMASLSSKIMYLWPVNETDDSVISSDTGVISRPRNSERENLRSALLGRDPWSRRRNALLSPACIEAGLTIWSDREIRNRNPCAAAEHVSPLVSGNKKTTHLLRMGGWIIKTQRFVNC